MDLSENIEPFPLRRRFLLYVLPGLVLVVAALLIAVSQAISTSAERMYVQDTSTKHQLIVATLVQAGGSGWVDQKDAGAASGASDGLGKLLSGEIEELGFDCAAIRSLDDRLILSTSPDGCVDERGELTEALAAPGDSGFLERGRNGPDWFVASVVKDRGLHAPVIVITRQVARTMEALIGFGSTVWIASLLAAFAAVLAGAIWLIGRAQAQIDQRTGALIDARRSLARFVSRHGQAQAILGQGQAQRVKATVLFLDIRDFSGFSDTASPDTAVAFVETVAEVAFKEILVQGGDVDRLLGDGLIAWFDGEDRLERAWRAVASILPRLEAADLPRGVGAGMHDGEVVEATIGVGERLDHTVLGRTVNIAARLCGAAGPGEMVASETMGMPPAGVAAQIGNREFLKLKGLAQPIASLRVRF